MRRRLAVVAPNVADAVQFAGGWLFDHVMAGWDVTVAVADPQDVRPIRILGATTVDLEAALSSPIGPMPESIAVSVNLYESDSRIREGMLDALDSGLTRIAVWGDALPSDLDRKFDSIQHRLSVAARAFKSHALAAAAAPADSPGTTETFRSSGTSSVRDLASVG
ncbi:hypothetical protein M1M07_04615 [Rhodococcus sp. HM1]|nr:hypothetical protein [Rhodococcus sp. HM1]